eukprot:1389115-Prymnesium_polylepis.1
MSERMCSRAATPALRAAAAASIGATMRVRVRRRTSTVICTGSATTSIPPLSTSISPAADSDRPFDRALVRPLMPPNGDDCGRTGLKTERPAGGAGAPSSRRAARWASTLP